MKNAVNLVMVVIAALSLLAGIYLYFQQKLEYAKGIIKVVNEEVEHLIIELGKSK